MTIELFRPLVTDAAIKAVEKVLRSGWLGQGPVTEEFERRFAAYVGAPHCVAVNKGTAALHIALHLLDVQPGDEVITTPLTFVATNEAILYEGATPVWADVEAATGNISTAAIADRINERTRAIIVVHYAGLPADLDEIYELADADGIPVIEDCAHACGAAYRGRKVGSHGHLHTFSFDPVKNLTSGEGGALTLSSSQFTSRARRLRFLGIDTSQIDRAAAWTWDYDVVELGFRYHMSDIHAAIALTHLDMLDEQNARRRSIAAHYRERLGRVPGVALLEEKADRESSHHLFAVLVENRDDLVAALRRSGIRSSVHYRRNDLFRIFEPAELPNVERFWRQELSLPMHLLLTDDDVDRICDTVQAGW